MQTLKAVMDKIDMLKYSSARTDTHQAAYTRAAATPEPTRLVGSGATMQAMKKDILDTELDLITRQGTDQDTSQLRHRLLELTQQVGCLLAHITSVAPAPPHVPIFPMLCHVCSNFFLSSDVHCLEIFHIYSTLAPYCAVTVYRLSVVFSAVCGKIYHLLCTQHIPAPPFALLMCAGPRNAVPKFARF